MAVAPKFDDARDESEIPEWLRTSWSLAMQCRSLALRNFSDATPVEYTSLLWLAAVRRSEFKSSATSTSEKRALSVLPTALALAGPAIIHTAEVAA